MMAEWKRGGKKKKGRGIKYHAPSLFIRPKDINVSLISSIHFMAAEASAMRAIMLPSTEGTPALSAIRRTDRSSLFALPKGSGVWIENVFFSIFDRAFRAGLQIPALSIL